MILINIIVILMNNFAKSLSVATILTTQFCAAQDTTYQLSLTTVGPNSDVRWVPNGDNKGGAPEAITPNSAPPQSIHYKDANGKKQNIKLSLNKPANYITYNDTNFTLYKSKVVNGSLIEEKYHTIELPETPGKYSIIITKRKEANSWDMPKTFILPDNTEHFPAGSLRLSNHSSTAITIKVGKNDSITLEPASTKTYKAIFNQDAKVSFEASFQLGKRKKWLAKSSLSKPKQTLLNAVFVESSDKKRPITTHFFTTPQPPIP